MIDREKAIKGLECCISGQSCKGCPYKEQGECEYSGYHFKAIRDALALLKEQEAVVRCKDCKYFGDANNPCGAIDIYTKPDWFCADGERR